MVYNLKSKSDLQCKMTKTKPEISDNIAKIRYLFDESSMNKYKDQLQKRQEMENFNMRQMKHFVKYFRPHFL